MTRRAGETWEQFTSRRSTELRDELATMDLMRRVLPPLLALPEVGIASLDAMLELAAGEEFAAAKRRIVKWAEARWSDTDAQTVYREIYQRTNH